MSVSPVLGNSRSLNAALEEDVLQIAGSEANSSNDPSVKQSLRKSQEQNWGLAAGLRVARIPFDKEEDTVTNFIPQLFFENDLIFLRGLEGGIKITGDDVWQLAALGRLRYFDIPKRFQNDIAERKIYKWTADVQKNRCGSGAILTEPGACGDIKFYLIELKFDVLKDEDYYLLMVKSCSDQKLRVHYVIFRIDEGHRLTSLPCKWNLMLRETLDDI